MKQKGQCFCTEVQYEIELYPNSVVHCHCSICRRVHGAPFVTWVGGSSDSLQIIKGVEFLREFSSSPGVKRSFCGQCGSPLFFESPQWPKETSVCITHLQDGFAVRPRAHIFYGDKLDFISCDDGLPKYGGELGVTRLEAHLPTYFTSGSVVD